MLGPPATEDTWCELPWPLDSPQYQFSGFIAGVKSHTRSQWTARGVTVTVVFISDMDSQQGPVVLHKHVEGTLPGR